MLPLSVETISKQSIKKKEKKKTLSCWSSGKTLSFHCRGTWVQSLIRELRSHMPACCGPKKKKKKIYGRNRKEFYFRWITKWKSVIKAKTTGNKLFVQNYH